MQPRQTKFNEEITFNSRHLHNLLDAGYQNTNKAKQIGLENGYMLDEELSNRNHRVFRDKHDNSILVYTGSRTAGDFLITDPLLAVGLGRLTPRFNQSVELVDKVKKKYKNNKIVALGHSLGGSLAEYVNNQRPNDINKVISVNKGTGILFNRLRPNHVDIRTKTDPVSFLSNLQGGGRKFEIPDSFLIRPVRSHGYYNLKKFDKKLRF